MTSLQRKAEKHKRPADIILRALAESIADYGVRTPRKASRKKFKTTKIKLDRNSIP